MTRKLLVAAVAMAVLFGAYGRAEASTVTVATFEDPSGDSSNPLFEFGAGTWDGTSADPTGSVLTGSWSGTGLTLLFAPTGTDYTNVTFDIGSLTATGGDVGAGAPPDYVLFGSGGSFTFFQGATPLLTYSWNNATLTNTNLGASTLELDGVSIVAPAGSPLFGYLFTDPQSFSFAFANPTGVLFDVRDEGGSVTWTSAFTSSATVDQLNPVPEPGSMFLLGTGLLGLGSAVRRRMRKSREKI